MNYLLIMLLFLLLAGFYVSCVFIVVIKLFSRLLDSLGVAYEKSLIFCRHDWGREPIEYNYEGNGIESRLYECKKCGLRVARWRKK